MISSIKSDFILVNFYDPKKTNMKPEELTRKGVYIFTGKNPLKRGYDA
jgi:hypothetical protein